MKQTITIDELSRLHEKASSATTPERRTAEFVVGWCRWHIEAGYTFDEIEWLMRPTLPLTDLTPAQTFEEKKAAVGFFTANPKPAKGKGKGNSENFKEKPNHEPTPSMLPDINA